MGWPLGAPARVGVGNARGRAIGRSNMSGFDPPLIVAAATPGICVWPVAAARNMLSTPPVPILLR
jgi:hypothetical protein